MRVMAARSGNPTHSYWGIFANETQLPNVAASPTQTPQLEVGDTAYASGGTSGLYVCTTATLGSAVWALLSTGAGASTPRPAPVFVVAEDGYLQTLSSVASPPNPANNGNLTGGVGDVVGTTCDYLDPGDGTELEQALLAAAAAGVGIDVRLRPCDIVFNPANITSLPLIVPDDCSLIGAGREASRLTGGNGTGTTTQQMFEMGENATLASLFMRSPAPAVASPASAVFGVITNQQSGSNGDNWVVRDCNLQIDFNSSIDRVERAMIHDQTGSARILDCDFTGGNGWPQPASGEAVAVFLGRNSFSIAVNPTRPAQVRNCRSTGFNTVVAIQNVQRPVVIDGFTAVDVFAPFGAFRYRADFTASVTFRGPYWSNLYVEANNFYFGAPNTERCAFFIDADRSATLTQFQISNCAAHFTNQGSPQPTYGLWIRSDAIIQQATARGLSFTGIFSSLTIGAYLDLSTASSISARLDSLRLSEITVTGPATNGGVGGRGAYFDASAGIGSINDCSILNSDLSGAQVAGVEITASVNNTQVGWNVLTPGAGSALIDAGTATIAANNVP